MLGENRQKKGSSVVIEEVQANKAMTLLAGIDAGSTETRVCLADAADMAVFQDNSKAGEQLALLKASYNIPSTYATVEDAREIPSASRGLEDNYDSTVMLVRNSAEKPLMSRHRVLRGRKITDATGLVPRYMDSSTNKVDNPIFYVNIIDSLGYALLQKYSGRIPHEVNIYLSLSVRPKELTTLCKAKLKENLEGTFVFSWKGMDITINIKALNFTTEPEAQIAGTIMMCDLKTDCGIDAESNSALANQLDNSDCYVHIEGGGSSIGVEVVRGRNLIDACSSTFPLGGNYMAQVFIDRTRELMGRVPTKEAANTAIVTCQLRDGRNLIDVSDTVAQAKSQVALSIVESLRHQVIDLLADLTLPDVEFITLGGRLFSADDAGNTIGEYIEEYVHQLSPNTEVITLKNNYIAQGNLVTVINSDNGADAVAMMETEKALATPTASSTTSTFPAAEVYPSSFDE